MDHTLVTIVLYLVGFYDYQEVLGNRDNLNYYFLKSIKVPRPDLM